MSNRAPAFLNKPNHSGTVVATARGWVVEETGELLVSVKNLDKRISEYLGTVIALVPPVLDEVVAPIQVAPEAIDVKALIDNLPETPLPVPDAVIAPEAAVVAPVVDAVVIADAPADAVAPVADAVAADAPAAPVVAAEPEVVKPRRGRPPKVRPEAEQPAPVAAQ